MRRRSVLLAAVALVASRVPLDLERHAEFCRRWGVRELALFGSVLRDEFDPERSDVDVLFPSAASSLWLAS